MSNEMNGEPVHVSKILAQANAALRLSDGQLLSDIASDYPILRAILLGIQHEDIKWAAGTLTIRRDGHEVAATLTITDYALQATLRDNSICNLLERFEAHLDCKTTPWDKTFREKQRDKQRIAKARGGS